MDSPIGRERRRAKRRNLNYYLPIINENNQQIFGHLVDLSTKGLMADSPKAVPTNQDFHLRMELTESIRNKSMVRFTARSKWCRTDPIQPSLFNVGFELTAISPSDLEIVQEIAEKYGSV
jgi:hypothetical protein